MNIEAQYLEIPFDKGGVRNSQKRLKSLITEIAVDPLKPYADSLNNQLDMVQAIVQKRVAQVITYWCEHKHDPVKPTSQDMMSTITNSTKNDLSLEEFYIEQVKSAMYALASFFSLDVPDAFDVKTDELEYALIELEEREIEGARRPSDPETYRYDDDMQEDDSFWQDDEMWQEEPEADEIYMAEEASLEDDSLDVYEIDDSALGGLAALAQTVAEQKPERKTRETRLERPAREPKRQEKPRDVRRQEKTHEMRQPEKAIVIPSQSQMTAAASQEVDLSVLNVTAERAWQLTYEMIGYPSDYIQQQMLPRWQQNPDTFDKDRRFLYQVFTETIRTAAGVQIVAGNYRFADRPVTIDQLWGHYLSDLTQNVGPQLTTARLNASVNETWYKKLFGKWFNELKKISPVWLAALSIALIFDGLTTYVSLDQTPMDGVLVIVFSVLITVLFQIADLLVISYRHRQFDAEALIAKYHARFQQLVKTLDGLDAISDSYVQLSMEKSRVHADWKAAEDNHQMARRGRFWSARIADINIGVTAYGFAYMFLNSSEPMFAVLQQIDFIFFKGNWENVDIWVFLMVGMAVTVSFVINTAQRTEILGWSMRRMKNEM